MAVSSINFQKSSEHSYDHNFRYDSPNYLLKEEDRLENSYWENDLSAKEIFNNELSRSNRRGGRIPKFENSHWEAVLNLNKEHTLDDVKQVADYLENKLNITCATISVHRDEGHYKKNGKVCYNFHAHLTFVTYKDGQQNWRQEKVRKKLGEIQTEVAKILKMERGQENSKKTRLSAKQYKKVAQELEAKDQTIQEIIDTTQETTNTADDCIKELKAKIQTQDQEIQKLEEELEEEKLSKAKLEAKYKKELEAELEKLRKNSKNQGFSKEYFQEINKEKKLLRFKTLDEFNEWVQELKKKHTTKVLLGNKVNEEAVLKDMYKGYQELEAQNQELEAENETLKAENERWNELLKANLALKKAYDYALEALKNKNKPKTNLNKMSKTMQDQTHNESESDDLGIDKIFKKVDKIEVKEQDQEQKNEVIQTQNPENTQTPNNEELTENNGKQATYFLNNFFKDDVSIFSKTNTDKTEISEEYQEQNQTHNQTKTRKNT